MSKLFFPRMRVCAVVTTSFAWGREVAEEDSIKIPQIRAICPVLFFSVVYLRTGRSVGDLMRDQPTASSHENLESYMHLFSILLL